MFTAIGSFCVYPRATYSAADLPADNHLAVRSRFLRACRKDILPGARSIAERRGLEERCEEIASAMYLHWYGLRSPKIARGDHGHAVASVIKYFRLTGWHGMTGYRRSKSRRRTGEMLRWMDRRRQSMQDRPDTVFWAKVRVGESPALSRKAYRLSQQSGLPGGVPELLQTATLAECSDRGTFSPGPVPATGLPAVDGDGTEWRGRGGRFNGAVRLRDDERQRVA